MRLPMCNPLVNGAWDPMLCAIRNFFVIGHPFGAIVNEWVEFIVTEAVVHGIAVGRIILRWNVQRLGERAA